MTVQRRWRDAREDLLCNWPAGHEFGGGKPHAGDPADILLALAKDEKQNGEGLQPMVDCANTQAAVGIELGWTVVGCPKHSGQAIDRVTAAATHVPRILDVVRPPGGRPKVQHLVDVMKDSIRVGNASDDVWYFEGWDCPFCPDGEHGAKVDQSIRLRLDGGRPNLFFARVEQEYRERLKGVDGGVQPCHGVDIFGAVYSLIAIVYSTSGGFHFVSQVFMPAARCWVTYNDRQNSACRHSHEFDADFNRGSEYLLLYVRTELVEGMSCKHAQPSDSESVTAARVAGEMSGGGGTSERQTTGRSQKRPRYTASSGAREASRVRRSCP